MPHAQNLWGFLLLIRACFVFALLCFLVHTQLLVAVCSVRNEDDGLERGGKWEGAGGKQGLQAERAQGGNLLEHWVQRRGKEQLGALKLRFKLHFCHYQAVGKDAESLRTSVPYLLQTEL